MPYRSETELLEGFNNSKEAFLNREDRLKELSSHMRQFRELEDQQLEKLVFNQALTDVMEKIGCKIGCFLTGKLQHGWSVRLHTVHRLLKLPVQKDGVIFLHLSKFLWYLMRMLCMIDSRLRQLKSRDACFGGINVLLFGDPMQLPPVQGHQVFQQPEHTKPAHTHLWPAIPPG
ncbi:hypothetical protein KQX54_011285 [Cotesia glomerata]|uniref:ATP-dependent DNA helicase n=1 Tax=Cotesia glomerata TaxID=32391 RepID=A0AAV7I6U0_COTGL|nr:hypothetical protein KQX54_011285 [Cotesia glomerata]